MMEFVNWDDDIPNISGTIQKMATKPPTRYGILDAQVEHTAVKTKSGRVDEAKGLTQHGHNRLRAREDPL